MYAITSAILPPKRYVVDFTVPRLIVPGAVEEVTCELMVLPLK
jgi:hypothetical protein